MRLLPAILWAAAFSLLPACGSRPLSTITVIDGESVQELRPTGRVPVVFLVQAGIEISRDDRLFLNGAAIALDAPIPGGNAATLQIRRAVEVKVMAPDGERSIRTAATTIAEAMREQGFELTAGDDLDPAAGAFISGPMSVSLRPARSVELKAAGTAFDVISSQGSVGEALAEIGMPLQGMDYSVPGEQEAMPADGQIRLVRVAESLVLSLKPIPYTTEVQESAEAELGEEVLLQPGLTGLAMSRTRIRYEDGREASRLTESESVVRPPQTRIAARGTKIVLKTATVDGTAIQYWRALEMYATSYSPCRSGVAGQCFSGTSLGLPVQRGVVAVDISFYNQMAGQQIYVAGYGPAVIADVGAGRIIEANLGVPRTRWIDLGYRDSDWQHWGGYVTVYFLAPAPEAIPSVLQ